MPAEKKSFLFQYIEKIACAVVALGLILVVVVSLRRNRGDEIQQVLGTIAKATDELKGWMNEKPSPEPIKDYPIAMEMAKQVTPPERVKDVVARVAVTYPEVWLGTAQERILTFRKVLEPRTAKIVGPAAENVLTIIESAVGGDRSKVKVRAGNEEGLVTFEAQTERTYVTQNVRVKRGMNAVAHPPLDPKAEAERGGIVITFMPNPANERHVAVETYAIYREDPREITKGFTLLTQLAADREDLTWTQTGTIGPRAGGSIGVTGEVPPALDQPGWGVVPSESEGETRGTGDETEAGYAVLDPDVSPDLVYSYKIRAMPYQKYQKPSEFTEVVAAETWPNIDFKYTYGRPQPGQEPQTRLQFEVACYVDGEFYRETFSNRIGDMIGGAKKTASGIEYFRTGCYLVDCHYVKAEKGFAYGRITYVDRRGRLRTRYKGEVAAPDLWEGPRARARATSTVQRTVVRSTQRTPARTGGGEMSDADAEDEARLGQGLSPELRAGEGMRRRR